MVNGSFMLMLMLMLMLVLMLVLVLVLVLVIGSEAGVMGWEQFRKPKEEPRITRIRLRRGYGATGGTDDGANPKHEARSTKQTRITKPRK